MKKRALISVSDKTGIIDFAKELVKFGYEIISTGGTYKILNENMINVISVSDITGFAECLDGRVKTLHPKIHGGILAIRDNELHIKQLSDLDIIPIDIVVVNLYPFKQTILKPDINFQEAIENIDIGGPSMIRAAAKNWQNVTVLVDHMDYSRVIDQLKENDKISNELRYELCIKSFEHTASYDATISSYLKSKCDFKVNLDTITFTYEKLSNLRYGENPHQSASLYKDVSNSSNSIISSKQLHGKELSYNNINDANAALELLKEIEDNTPISVAIKHANPCGVGKGENLFDAYLNCYNSDPVSIFGGIIAVNKEIDEKTAEEMSKIFLEIIIAPKFSYKALEILKLKKNIRLLELNSIFDNNLKDTYELKKINGGILIQDVDNKLYDKDDIKVVTKKSPTEKEMQDLEFAFKVVKHVKSNGIVLVKDNKTIGIGPGQTNRITALELAIKYAGDNVEGSVMASDAFFPFDDCVKLASKHGIKCIIQPGGSLKDEDSIKACDMYGISMVFTGMRHFKH